MVINEELLKEICFRFFQNRNKFILSKIESGLINLTYKVSFESGDSFILQAINKNVFKDPFAVMNNIRNIADHLQKSSYPFKILEPITSSNNLLEPDHFGNYWRAFPFFEKTTVLQKPTNPNQAFEAAKCFGLFIRHLDTIDLKSIKKTIPNFHNLNYHKQRLDKVLMHDKFHRKAKAAEEIKKVTKWFHLLKFDFSKLPTRIVHNDAKISNILFDKNGEKGVSIIDLDTVMPGPIINDFGDLVRTMCCTASEDEINLEKVSIDRKMYHSTAEGFLEGVQPILKNIEKENLLYGCVYIIFEQALRFLTDYLAGDNYYAITYPEQNLFRAKNQNKLLESLLEKRLDLQKITN